MLSTLKSSDNMIQLDDDEMNQLIGTGALALKPRGPFPGMTDCRTNFKFIIHIKEGRYQYTVNNSDYFYYQNGIAPVRSNLNKIITNNWGGKPLKKSYK